MAAAKEFNIGKDTLVDFLVGKGFDKDELKPTAKLTEPMYRALQAEFQSDKVAKQKAVQIDLPKGSAAETKKKKDEEEIYFRKEEKGARARAAPFGDRVRFEHRSIFELGLADKTFDLVVCRHVLQAVPHPERVIAELARVTKRGGWLHLIAEDYLMINFEPRRLDPDDFWNRGPRAFGEAIGTNLRIGRKTYGILRRLGFTDITIDYVVVDPLRVPRDTLAAIWVAWRDGFADAIAQHTAITREQFNAHFEDMIATIHDPSGYGVWHVPVVAARVVGADL